jgi:hypothetical protein
VNWHFYELSSEQFHRNLQYPKQFDSFAVPFLLQRIFADSADVPRFNAKGFKAWLTELEGFCQVANDWAMVRARVFNEINTALEHRNDIAGVLNLTWSLPKEPGQGVPADATRPLSAQQRF